MLKENKHISMMNWVWLHFIESISSKIAVSNRFEFTNLKLKFTIHFLKRRRAKLFRCESENKAFGSFEQESDFIVLEDTSSGLWELSRLFNLASSNSFLNIAAMDFDSCKLIAPSWLAISALLILSFNLLMDFCIPS